MALARPFPSRSSARKVPTMPWRSRRCRCQPGLAVAKASIAAKAAEAKVTVTAAVAAPLGTTTIVLQAKGKLGGADRVLDLPAVTLSVVPPASLELAATSLEIKPGATVELKGKIVRKGSFNAPVTVKINGLPAGTKAEPVTVAAKDSSFVMKVSADAKAAAATADTRVAPGFSGREEGLFGSADTAGGEGSCMQSNHWHDQSTVVSCRIND